MNEQYRQEARTAIQYAQQALRQGNRREAHQWAAQAARLAPDLEVPWLILAAVSAPNASVYYLRRALEINPNSERARQGMHWALKRQREQAAEEARYPYFSKESTTQVRVFPKRVRTQKKQPQVRSNTGKILGVALPFVLIFAIICIGSIFFLGFPSSWTVLAREANAARPADALDKPSLTPTATETPTATFTPTSTFTPTLTPTSTATFTLTPLPTDTPTPEPTITPIPEVINNPSYNPVINYTGGNGERWIDINLSEQVLYAYEGDTIVGSFLVSTGTWQHPTVTGQYHIYVKYTYTDMSGPGYYLPDVPYTMYFYSGYGIHGTYWHNNFGTPMSHGCVNMRTSEAEWLFGWASVGTLVNIHY